MSSVPRNKPPKGSMSQFFFVFFLFFYDLYLSKYQYIHYVHIYKECLLIIGPVGGSAEQPLLALNGKALSQPRPHPSNRTE